MRIHITDNPGGNSSLRPKSESPKRGKVCAVGALCGAILAGAVAAQADVVTPYFPGGPAYTDVQRLADGHGTPYFFHDDQWAAFVFLRDTSCVPPNFNLLDSFDLAAFSCRLTVDGDALWKNGPEIDLAAGHPPVKLNAHGLGAVPVWFVKLSEVQAILAGNTLTVSQLLASPSLRKGHANVYEQNQLFGFWHPQGEGNGSIEVVANGFLDDGTAFQLEWRDMGKKDGNGQDFVRHVRIAFK
jgi:hypothetical protein